MCQGLKQGVRGARRMGILPPPHPPYSLSRFDTLLRVTLTIETKMATQYGKHLILKILQESRGLNWVFSETNKKFYLVWLYTDKLKIILTIFFMDLY